MNLVVYDCEIIRAIPDKGSTLIPGIEYCAGWRDFEHMGISVICAYQALEGYRVFLDDNFEAFKALARDPNTLLAGFNSRNFDDKLLSATFGITIPPMRSFDLLREIWRAKGLEPDSFSPAHGGYGLDAMAEEEWAPGQERDGCECGAPVAARQEGRGDRLLPARCDAHPEAP